MMGAADQIQPFLDVFFMGKAGFIPFPFRLEEDVQVKFVELSPQSDLPDVGQKSSKPTTEMSSGTR